MAQGPPDGGEHIGFAVNWREAVDISSLPWGNLLRHLNRSDEGNSDANTSL
jgi:hypothetical protein